MKKQSKNIWNNPNFRYVGAFVRGVQIINALQPLARLAFFTATFGDTEGAKFAERMEKYGLWFLIDQFTHEQESTFYEAIYKNNATTKTISKDDF
jgi:hypothetical protein